MHPRHHAASDPSRAAVILADSGRIVTYAALEARANQAAHLFRSVGLAIGGSVAVLLDNHERYLEFVWAAQRSGLYCVCLSSRLTAAEIAYIVADSGATAIVTSHAFAPLVADLAPTILFVEDDPAAAFPDTPIADERAGTDILYSSGTTGRPKGIRLTLPEDGAIDGENALETLAARRESVRTRSISAPRRSTTGMWADERGTNLLDTGAPFYDTYETADGKFVSIGSLEPHFYALLCESAGLGEDFDLSAWPARRAALTDIFRRRTRDEWCAAMEGSDVCFAPVLSMAEAPAHPHNAARGTFVEAGGVTQPAPAPRYSVTPTRAPEMPEDESDADAVLAGLGYDAERIAGLRSAGAVG